MATAWRVVQADHTSAYGNGYNYYERPVVHSPVGATVEHEPGIWVWHDDAFDWALRFAGRFESCAFLEIEYDPVDVVPCNHAIAGVDMPVRRCRVVRELDLAERYVHMALKHATNADSSRNGAEHWRSVGANGAAIAAKTPGANPTIVAAFAAYHDSQRLPDGDDPGHGERAVEIGRRLPNRWARHLTMGGPPWIFRQALRDHSRGLVSDDPTVGACWDADRLERASHGEPVRLDLLSTDVGRKLAKERGIVA
jgi:uncharacterized protein